MQVRGMITIDDLPLTHGEGVGRHADIFPDSSPGDLADTPFRAVTCRFATAVWYLLATRPRDCASTIVRGSGPCLSRPRF